MSFDNFYDKCFQFNSGALSHEGYSEYCNWNNSYEGKDSHNRCTASNFDCYGNTDYDSYRYFGGKSKKISGSHHLSEWTETSIQKYDTNVDNSGMDYLVESVLNIDV